MTKKLTKKRDSYKGFKIGEEVWTTASKSRNLTLFDIRFPVYDYTKKIKISKFKYEGSVVDYELVKIPCSVMDSDLSVYKNIFKTKNEAVAFLKKCNTAHYIAKRKSQEKESI